MTDRLQVDPAVLQQAQQGIQQTLDEMAELAGMREIGNVGRGFSTLTLGTESIGKHSVQQTFEEFTERWTWSVRALVRTGNTIAQGLGWAVGRYYEMEQQASNTLKEMWTHMLGNPHLSEEEIDARSASETFADNPINHVLNPDYSPESFAEAKQHIQQNNDLIEQLAPQALANLTGTTVDGHDPGFHTGALEEAARNSGG